MFVQILLDHLLVLLLVRRRQAGDVLVDHQAVLHVVDEGLHGAVVAVVRRVGLAVLEHAHGGERLYLLRHRAELRVLHAIHLQCANERQQTLNIDAKYPNSNNSKRPPTFTMLTGSCSASAFSANASQTGSNLWHQMHLGA